AHTTTGCGKQGFPSAQPYLSHTPGANPFCCMFLVVFHHQPPALSRDAELSSIYLYDCCISNAAWVKETIILHIVESASRLEKAIQATTPGSID
ncbi:hypothetical protein BO72DRAFT_369729, partial [Aspergillus fijiensis CBS 313.89]